MNSSRVSITTVLLIAIIISAIGFFFSVTLVDLAVHPAVNDYYEIEGTDFGIYYTSQKPSGVYQGGPITGVLKLEGNFGFDWGAEVEGDRLYVNEYSTTTFGYMLCNFVRIDLNTFEKEVLYRDTILRGRCASGELVCLRGVILPSNYPKTNALSRLYSMSSSDLRPESESTEIIYLDPVTLEVLYRTTDSNVLTSKFDSRYLEKSLEEVRR